MSEILFLPGMDLTPVLTQTQGQKENKVKCFKEASLRGSIGAFGSWCNTRERFQEGIPLRTLGLSLWKLSRRQVRFSSLLIFMGEFPGLSAMADL